MGPQLVVVQLAAVQPDLMRRLDDSSNRVRVAACTALQAWLRGVLAAGGGGGLADAVASSLASTLLIHADDADDDVAAAACALLEQLGTARPSAVRPLAEAAAAGPARRAMLARVVAACGSGGA